MGILRSQNLLLGVSYLEDPKVSVVIPVYNAERYLARCMESLVAQTYQNINISY